LNNNERVGTVRQLSKTSSYCRAMTRPSLKQSGGIASFEIQIRDYTVITTDSITKNVATAFSLKYILSVRM